jgi:hypothetical protein
MALMISTSSADSTLKAWMPCDNPVRTEACFEREIELTRRADIGTKALLGNQPEERSIRIRLDGVVRRVPPAVERTLEVAAVVHQRLPAVDEQRRAV